MSGIIARIDNALFQKTVNLFVLGLDNAGKTTLIHRLMDHRMAAYPPTISPLENSFELNNIMFKCTEFGGFSERNEFPFSCSILY